MCVREKEEGNGGKRQCECMSEKKMAEGEEKKVSPPTFKQKNKKMRERKKNKLDNRKFLI